MNRIGFPCFALFVLACSPTEAAWNADASPADEIAADEPRESLGLDEAARLAPRSPLSGYSLYVEPNSHAADQAVEWASSDPAGAALMASMAEKPLGLWIGDWTSDVTGTVDDAVTAGGTELRTLVLYNIPDRDCGAYSSGGASDATEYATFIAEVAAGLDGRLAIIILEPDALPLTTCLDAAGLADRTTMMADAVDTLTAAGARVYIDAGDSNWIGATTMASLLTAAGVANAAGFSLNVSHTEYTGNEVAFAGEIRAIIGTDAHYVIDTGRNALGPTADNEWCNPRERGLGLPPTTKIRRRGLDALLWVKPPGESDGDCGGGPSAGAWWPEYALELAEYSPY